MLEVFLEGWRERQVCRDNFSRVNSRVDIRWMNKGRAKEKERPLTDWRTRWVLIMFYFLFYYVVIV